MVKVNAPTIPPAPTTTEHSAPVPLVPAPPKTTLLYVAILWSFAPPSTNCKVFAKFPAFNGKGASHFPSANATIVAFNRIPVPVPVNAVVVNSLYVPAVLSFVPAVV